MIADTRAKPASRDDNTLIIASRVKDTNVFNTSGDRLGHIEDISIDRVTGQVRYALMSFGGFLGIGDKLHPLPWQMLRFDTDKNGYVVGLSKEQLSDAPSYTAEELAAFGGRDVDYRDGLFRYYSPYGVAPYWM